MLGENGTYNISVHLAGENSLITSEDIMPGDNIKEFFNSYEDGLFEKII